MKGFRVASLNALGLGVGLLVLASVLGPGASPSAQERNLAGRCRAITMYAEELPRSEEGEIRLGYGLRSGKASIPGPLITLIEGECIDVTLVNHIPADTLRELRASHNTQGHRLPLAVSIHPHGVRYTKESDGTVSSRSFVRPGESRTFRWRASAGTAGYWWYHDHVVGTPHGTAGMDAGLFGGLIVRRPRDPKPDVPTFVVAMGNNSTINLRRFPETPTFRAKQGQRIEFLVFGWGHEFHSFHLHGHRWADTRTGLIRRDDDAPTIDNKTVGPGDSFGFQVIAGQGVGPNRWMYHCHVQFHSDMGMSGFLKVLPRA